MAVAMITLSSCGADGPDAYSVALDEAVPTTARTIPPTTPVPSDDEGVGDDETSAPAALEFAPNGEVVEVRALDNTFRLADIDIVAGTEVRWLNGGRNEHDVIPIGGIVEWGVAKQSFAPTDEYSAVFVVPGTYLYYCSIHGTETVGMVGSVTVSAPDA